MARTFFGLFEETSPLTIDNLRNPREVVSRKAQEIRWSARAFSLTVRF